MAVDTTNLLAEVQAVIEDGEKQSHHHLIVTIKIGEEWVAPTRVDAYYVNREYELSFGDVRVLEVLMPLGDYAYDIVPNKDSLWVDVFTEVKGEGGQERVDLPLTQRRFRAILMESDNPGFGGSSPQASSKEDLNLSGMHSVQLQLIEESLHQVRLMSVGRIYRNAIPMDALKAVLTETTQLLNVNQQQHIFGVDVVGNYNTTVREHVMIDHGTPLSQLTKHLQMNEGGLYGAGAGCYLQNGQWYVYPLYDPTRVRKDPGTLTVIRVPPNRYAGAERTYRITDNEVVIIANGGVTIQDDGLSSQLNEGNAVRVGNARTLLTPTTTEGNTSRTDRAQNVYEMQGNPMDAGLTHAKWAPGGPTSNPFKHYTEMARRNGRYVFIEWTLGDIDLLYPGMPVKYLSAIEGDLAEYDGVLLGVNEQRLPNKPGMVADIFPSTILLKVFLTRMNQL